MELEQQVCSLDLAKKLKELKAGSGTLGQISLWHWYFDDAAKKWDIAWHGSDDLTRSSKETFAAFTVAELGEMLPAFIEVGEKKNSKRFKLYLAKNESEDWFIEYHEWNLEHQDNYELLVQRTDDTEANSRAKMLLYLMENRLLRR